MKEAQSINKSLSSLEQVMLALQAKQVKSARTRPPPRRKRAGAPAARERLVLAPRAKEAGFRRDPAPHHLTRASMSFAPRPGEGYELWVRVGGGGGHALTVVSVRARVLAYS